MKIAVVVGDFLNRLKGDYIMEGFAGFCILWVLGIVGLCIGFREARSSVSEQDTLWPYEIEDAVYSHDEPELEKKSDWDTICEKAIEKAKEGDTSARAWVTKHIYEAEEKVDTPTDKSVIDQAILALRALGLNKVEAETKAVEFGSKKCYSSVEDLIQDVFKKE